MTRDRRGAAAGGDGLLYIPDDDLVRTTVEGDDAEWSDARSYVPSDALISSVLRASVRETPRFKFPDWYASPPRGGEPVRAASAILGALQLSPATLAAATVLHVVALVVLGPLTIVGAHGSVATPHAPTTIDAPRLIYFAPAPPQPAPRRERRPVGVAVNPNGFELVKPGSPASAAVSAADSLPATVDRRARADSGREDRELATALDREFRLGGDPLRVEAPDRARLEELSRILGARPLARLRVTGIGPLRSERALGARPGMREAELVARELINLGVARERIDLETGVAEQPCPEREPLCAAGRSRVRTSLAPSPR
jgi:hypothetical protein